MFHLRRIVCPVDFSSGSRHALDFAGVLARSCDARISVLYIHALPVPLPAAGHSAVVHPLPLSDRERSGVDQHLAEFVVADRAAGLDIDTAFEESLAVAPAIVEAAAANGADLIVMGTHGRTGFNRLVLGAVADRVVKTAGCPVVVVPPQASERVPLAFHRVLAAVDFSPPSARALEIAGVIAAKTRARITALHVLDIPADLPQQRAEWFERARPALAAAVSAAELDEAAVDELLVVGKPYREILRIAVEQQADLIVVGTQGHGALDLITFGTTTHRLVRQASCPVLTVRSA